MHLLNLPKSDVEHKSRIFLHSATEVEINKQKCVESVCFSVYLWSKHFELNLEQCESETHQRKLWKSNKYEFSVVVSTFVLSIVLH